MPPKLNRQRAAFVLTKIDEILAWEKNTSQEREARFVDLGSYLCEVRAGQYWRVDNIRSFDEFLEKKFPGSRRKAYYLMAIHEQLPHIHKVELKLVGWTRRRNWRRSLDGTGSNSIVQPGCTRLRRCRKRSLNEKWNDT